jgi:hypothetical protein
LTSFRVIRCGIKIFPKANITIRSGMLTIGMIPGKTFQNNVTTTIIPTA